MFCGVTFMAETAKILNPEKTVLLPDPAAICAMAQMCSPEQIIAARERNPGKEVVGYVNSTAACKAEMDVCCTSSNAIEIVSSLESSGAIFVPDRNLGTYAARSCPDKDVVVWNGFCPIHQSISVQQVAELKAAHPDAEVLAHPECRTEVLDMADVIGSTEKMLNHCRSSDKTEFIVLTEVGMGHRLEVNCPGKSIHFPRSAVCGAMKMATLETIAEVLENMSNPVELPAEVVERARRPVERMIGRS